MLVKTFASTLVITNLKITNYEWHNYELRSGTSIAANVEEAIGAQSRKDFFHKITIAYKEARESHCWIRLLSDTGYLDSSSGKRLTEKVEEILRILGSIQTSLKTKLKKHS